MDNRKGQKPRRKPCPTYRQFVSALNAISQAVVNQSFEDQRYRPGVAVDPRLFMEANRELCSLLLALLQCGEFWNRLWVENLDSALQLLDLSRLEDELDETTIDHLVRFFEELGMAPAVAESYVRDRLSDCHYLADQFVAQYQGQPTGAVLKDLVRRAEAQVMGMRDEVCNPLDKAATKATSDDWARKLLVWARRLLGSMVIGAMGSSPQALSMDSPEGPAYRALRGDDRIRLLLTVISILTLHAMNAPGADHGIVLEPEPV